MSEEQPEPPRATDQPVEQSAEQHDQEPARPVEVKLRRAPRYRVFIATGAVVGAVLGVVLALTRATGDGLFSAGTVTGYLGVIGLLVGALLGGVVAVLADRPDR